MDLDYCGCTLEMMINKYLSSETSCEGIDDACDDIMLILRIVRKKVTSPYIRIHSIIASVLAYAHLYCIIHHSYCNNLGRSGS